MLCVLSGVETHPPAPRHLKPEEGSGDKSPGFDPTSAAGLDDQVPCLGPGLHCLSRGREAPLLAHAQGARSEHKTQQFRAHPSLVFI